jgi:DNA-binding Lrp family transcriptional regulator
MVNLINRLARRMEGVVRSQQLDPTDRRILLALDDDPRAPVMVLAQRLGLARGTVQSRLERMTASGVLRANSTRVHPESLGRGVLAEVSAELDQSHIDEAIAALGGIPEVLECLAPAGDTDLLIRVVATSPDDLYRVSEEIRLCPGIRRTSTRMILRTVIPYRTGPLLAEGREGTGPGA